MDRRAPGPVEPLLGVQVHLVEVVGGVVRAGGEAGGTLPPVLQVSDALFGEAMPW